MSAALARSTIAALAVAAALLCAQGAGAAPQPPPPTAEAGVLGIGSRGPTVRALQRELRARGLRVAVHGRFGARTRLAVARLQKRLGLRVNGFVDRPLLWSLGLSVCALPGPTSARGGPRGELRLGAYGPRVCTLQRALIRSGAPIRVDGGFGPQTRSAVRDAQRRLGLRPTGVADRPLLRRLRARPGAPGATPTAPGARALSIGARGPAVRGLQVALLRRGIAVEIDGVFGPGTRRAVRRAQRRLGLPVDGAVNAEFARRIGASAPNRLAAFPVDGPHSFTNDFGAPRHQGPHEGTDVFALRGTPVAAVTDGVVERLTRRERGLGGIWLWLRDTSGTGYYYAHLSRIAPGIAPGTRVSAGQRLGDVGRTGDARGTVPHLHFEIHPAGRGPLNPFAELRAADRVTPAAA